MQRLNPKGIMYVILIVVSVILFLFGFVMVVINQMTDNVYTYFFGNKGAIGGLCMAGSVILFLFTLSAIARMKKQ